MLAEHALLIRGISYRIIERILQVAVLRLGSSVEPEILVTIVIRTLTRLGYDVAMSKGVNPYEHRGIRND